MQSIKKLEILRKLNRFEININTYAVKFKILLYFNAKDSENVEILIVSSLESETFGIV